MMPYTVLFKPAAARELRKLPGDVRARVGERIDRLAEDPRPPDCTKLQGCDFFRVRAGDFRIIYQIQDDELVVLVVWIGNRRDVSRRP